MMTWAREFENMEVRRVARYESDCGVVSTVFLGLNHQFGDGPPLVFETMIFPKEGNWQDEYMDRYTTWEEAEAGHEKAVGIVKEREEYERREKEFEAKFNSSNDKSETEENSPLPDHRK